MASVQSSPKTPPSLKSAPASTTDHSSVNIKEEINDENSMHSYRVWLKEKEKQQRQQQQENNNKDQDGGKNGGKTNQSSSGNNSAADDDDNVEDDFRVDAVLERGPSPPESDNTSTYEWSYEEQFKQLYEIDEDPERKTFLDEYFEFMKGRGTPVSRIPIMAKQILDLFQLYNLVVKHGGLVQVIRNKQWSKITKGLNLPTSITSAAFTLRTQYLKYLYPYECAMHNFSTPKELQAAIDSNRRDRFSSLYHTEPTMTPSRDERYSPFTFSGTDYPGGQPRHHMTHPPLTPSQMDMRFNLKRPSDAMMSKSYDKYGLESPKVIVLQDNPPPMADSRSGKITPPPPSFHARSRSPGSDMRALAEMEARRRSHHFPYGKEWENNSGGNSGDRHVFEEETRRRMIDESRKNSTSTPCKDQNCNGIDCHYSRSDLHRHRLHDPTVVSCPCSYCKDYTSSRNYSPTRREIPRHHMDGASANNHHDARHNGSTTNNHDGTNGYPPSNHHHHHHHSHNNRDDPNDNKPTTTLKMKLPDVRRGGDTIFISLEVEGTVYEGTITSRWQQHQSQTQSQPQTPQANNHQNEQQQQQQQPPSLTNGNSNHHDSSFKEKNNNTEWKDEK